jgi:hypothetical protein
VSKQKRKIGRLSHEANTRPSPSIVVVFGTQRIGAIYALREGIDPGRIRLATGGDEMARLLSGPVTVVRVSDEAWQPPTHACARRAQETEQALKALREDGITIRDVILD